MLLYFLCTIRVSVCYRDSEDVYRVLNSVATVWSSKSLRVPRKIIRQNLQNRIQPYNQPQVNYMYVPWMLEVAQVDIASIQSRRDLDADRITSLFLQTNGFRLILSPQTYFVQRSGWTLFAPNVCPKRPSALLFWENKHSGQKVFMET